MVSSSSPEKVAELTDPTCPRSSSAVTVFMALLFVVYAALFAYDIRDRWFSPVWTTDDALQQLYPFHKIQHPSLFQDDVITTVMEGYLPPLHYWVTYLCAYLTGDPIIAGHWVMALQLAGALLFLFLLVRHFAGSAAAFFAITWFLHTRHIVQRMTAGLPRGWPAALFPAFLFFLATGRHRVALAVIFVGVLLSPPASVVMCFAYGIYLSLLMLLPSRRAQVRRSFVEAVLAAPAIVGLAWWISRKPPEIGAMIDFETALSMPEFQRPFGRFPFLPFLAPWQEISVYGFMAFITRIYDPGVLVREYGPLVVLGVLAGVVALGMARKRASVPFELWCFGAASLVAYFASRQFAFKLYVPDRHLQFPLGIFFIAALSISVWRVLHGAVIRPGPGGGGCRGWVGSVVGLLVVAALVTIGSGSGLSGEANFNYPLKKRGLAFRWLRENTPLESVVAGEPTHIDPVQLFARRQGYMTTETYHPFYPVYFAEMKRRRAVALRAHYATSLEQFLGVLGTERIDYFVFKNFAFRSDQLESSHASSDPLVRELTADPKSEFIFSRTKIADDPLGKAVVFRDTLSTVVDLKALRRFAEGGKTQ